MPAGVREHDPAGGRQPRIEVVRVPLPNLLANDRAVGVFALAEGVVDDRPVRRVAGDRVAHARAQQVAAVAGNLEEIVRPPGGDQGDRTRLCGDYGYMLPASGPFRQTGPVPFVGDEHRLREKLAILLAGHDPLHVAVEMDRQLVGVRGVHQPQPRIHAQQEGGEPP